MGNEIGKSSLCRGLSNEITAIPKLLLQLDIAGSVVTLDAMGCQTKIVDEIIERKADYMLSLKGNQGTLHDDVKCFFESDKTSPQVGFESIDGGLGRIKQRTVRASSDIDWLKKRNPHWRGLNSIVAVTAQCECNGRTSVETRYFITSLEATDLQRLGNIVRDTGACIGC